MPDDMTNFFREADEGGYPDISNLKKSLMDDLRNGLGRGKISKFIDLFDKIHKDNVSGALGVLAHQKQFNGYDPRVPRTIRLLKKWSRKESSIYNCSFLRIVINEMASDYNIW